MFSGKKQNKTNTYYVTIGEQTKRYFLNVKLYPETKFNFPLTWFTKTVLKLESIKYNASDLTQRTLT